MLRKRILSAVLSTALIFTTNVTLSQGQFTGTPLHANAVSAAGSFGDNLTWNLSGSTLTISGSGAMPDFKNYGEEPWLADYEKITTIKVSEGITAIGSYGFMAIRATSVSLPSTLTKIGAFAFSNCTALTSVTVPGSVTELGTYAFYFCTALSSVKFPDNLTTIGSYAFSDCTSLGSITLPKNLKTIGSSAFSSVSSLKSVVIPSGVTELPDTLFYRCSLLSSLTIPPSVTKIGKNACSGCSASLTIYGAPGSAAETYAKAIGVKFSSSGAPVTTPTATQTTVTKKTTAPTTTTTKTTTVTTTVDPQMTLIKGDVNGDYAIDSRDAVMILREYARLLLGADKGVFSPNQTKAADVNANGKIDLNDGRLVLKYFAESLLGSTPTWW